MISNILFVCTGNTCRSVMAELLLKKMLQEMKIEGIQVSSAGVAASAHYRIFGSLKNVMDEENIDVSSHVSTQVTINMLQEADLVLVMEKTHKDYLERALGIKEKLFLLKEYAGESENLDIADPIGQPEETYRRTMNEIRGYLERSLPKIIRKRSN